MPSPIGHPPYPGCETGGRPPKYTKEFIEKEAEALLKWIKDPKNIYLKRFAFERDYCSSRFTEFAKVNQKFALALKKAHEWQEIRLAEGGLSAEFNPGFTKFVLARTHGWTDKTEVKHTVADDAPEWLKGSINSSKDLLKDGKSSK